MKANYDIFSKFYDEVMGDRTGTADFLIKQIYKSNPGAKSVLELACGTGEIMKLLSKEYVVSGLELSDGMLEIARKKMPRAKFYKQSMVGFDLPEKYDVILCVFDSVNHLLKFSDWKKLFKSAYKYLNNGGVFLFDINTEQKLDEIVQDKAVAYESGENIVIMNTEKDRKGIVNWNVKIFEREKGDIYKMYEENIKEISFPRAMILDSLKQLFLDIQIVEQNNTKPNYRLYFICKKDR